MRVYLYSESSYSTFPTTLRQLTRRTNEHPFQSVVQRCFREIVWRQNWNFARKMSVWIPVLIKLYDNVSKTGLCNRPFQF